jgi:hypothetical protein
MQLAPQFNAALAAARNINRTDVDGFCQALLNGSRQGVLEIYNLLPNHPDANDTDMMAAIFNNIVNINANNPGQLRAEISRYVRIVIDGNLRSEGIDPAMASRAQRIMAGQYLFPPRQLGRLQDLQELAQESTFDMDAVFDGIDRRLRNH